MRPAEAALSVLHAMGFPVAAWLQGRRRCAAIKWRWCGANGWYLGEHEYRACVIFGVALPPVPKEPPYGR